MNNDNDPSIILASSSSYRANLLKRLKLPFTCHSPNVNETPLAGESAKQLAKRLSLSKAETIAKRFPEHWIIGSDQVAVCEDRLIGKPGNHKKALAQLKSFSGKYVDFYTGLSLVNQNLNQSHYHCETVQVFFKPLSDDLIESYLLKDTPYDCAGSFKVESLGVVLFEKVVCEDPTALEGLPLIALCQLFDKAGVSII